LTFFHFRVNVINMKISRPYTMRTRADHAETTRRRIIDAAVEQVRTRFRPDIRLEDVARGADVSVQTVLRIFGSRAGLLEQALRQLGREIAAQRGRAEPGDIAGGVSALFDHYEQVGDLVIRNLAGEPAPALQPGLEAGRARHREWVERQFGPQLGLLAHSDREWTVDALVCACDVYTWKLLRRDMGRSRAEAESTMARMVGAILGGT
jgi:AcrR family transcriptional regulator